MGQTTGIDVKKHDITGDSPSTRTFTHQSRGGRQWACAVRADFTADDDTLILTVKQRIPGRSSTASDDDYYDDEPIALFGASGKPGEVKLLANSVFGPLGLSFAGGVYVDDESGQQHVINIFWPPVGAELVIEAVESANVTLKAVTTWEVP